MSRADVESVVSLLSNAQYDPTVFDRLYQDVIRTLGPAKWLTTAVPITFTEGSTSVALPNNLLEIVCIIYDDTVLSPLMLRELEALNPGWRNVTGNPIAYTLEAETSKTIEVFPTPFTTSPPIVPVHGLPTGEDYVPGNGISIHSESRVDALPYLTLPLALKVLAREYVRESAHQDFAFGTLCDQLGDLLLKLLA
jgi:hypothetical protein